MWLVGWLVGVGEGGGRGWGVGGNQNVFCGRSNLTNGFGKGWRVHAGRGGLGVGVGGGDGVGYTRLHVETGTKSTTATTAA